MLGSEGANHYVGVAGKHERLLLRRPVLTHPQAPRASRVTVALIAGFIAGMWIVGVVAMIVVLLLR